MPKAAWSGWSSVGRPRPEPGRRHMTWETPMKRTAHIIPQTCKILTIGFLIQKFRFHAGRPTLPGQLPAWLKKWPHYIQLLQGTFLRNPWNILELTWFLMILTLPGRTNSQHSPTTHEQMTGTPPLVMSHPSPPLYSFHRLGVTHFVISDSTTSISRG